MHQTGCCPVWGTARQFVSKVGGVLVEQFQVLQAIILGVGILVVDNLDGRKRAPKRFSHYEPMLSDIATCLGVRMIWSPELPVATTKDTTAFPARVSCAGSRPWSLSFQVEPPAPAVDGCSIYSKDSGHFSLLEVLRFDQGPKLRNIEGSLFFRLWTP